MVSGRSGGSLGDCSKLIVLLCQNKKIDGLCNANMRKSRFQGFQEGVGECMEGQIGGKSGPGMLRTRQSGNLDDWEEAWEGPGGGPRLKRGRRQVVLQRFAGHSLARFF